VIEVERVCGSLEAEDHGMDGRIHKIDGQWQNATKEASRLGKTSGRNQLLADWRSTATSFVFRR